MGSKPPETLCGDSGNAGAADDFDLFAGDGLEPLRSPRECDCDSTDKSPKSLVSSSTRANGPRCSERPSARLTPTPTKASRASPPAPPRASFLGAEVAVAAAALPARVPRPTSVMSTSASSMSKEPSESPSDPPPLTTESELTPGAVPRRVGGPLKIGTESVRLKSFLDSVAEKPKLSSMPPRPPAARRSSSCSVSEKLRLASGSAARLRKPLLASPPPKPRDCSSATSSFNSSILARASASEKLSALRAMPTLRGPCNCSMSLRKVPADSSSDCTRLQAASNR
mmetsp:Transcript_95705/g.275785  ORF Transcript_95705/g.275785 Transcript_95705/m.275785 type:complete len:284 (-) Transcript_95705:1373-2224(-)